jgi:hypothetical protein
MFDFCNSLENLNACLVPHGSKYNRAILPWPRSRGQLTAEGLLNEGATLLLPWRLAAYDFNAYF